MKNMIWILAVLSCVGCGQKLSPTEQRQAYIEMLDWERQKAAQEHGLEMVANDVIAVEYLEKVAQKKPRTPLKDVAIDYVQNVELQAALDDRKSKFEAANAFMEKLAKACLKYREVNGKFLASEDFGVLTMDIHGGPFLDAMEFDPWQNSYFLADGYIVSAGPDQTFDTEDDLSLWLTSPGPDQWWNTDDDVIVELDD